MMRPPPSPEPPRDLTGAVRTRGDANPTADPGSFLLAEGDDLPVVAAVLPLSRLDVPVPPRALGPAGVAALGLLATAVAVRGAAGTPGPDVAAAADGQRAGPVRGGCCRSQSFTSLMKT